MYFLQLLIRENIGHACIFIVDDGRLSRFMPWAMELVENAVEFSVDSPCPLVRSPKPHPSKPHPCNMPQAKKTEVALQFSRSASGGCLHGGANFKREKAHFAA